MDFHQLLAKMQQLDQPVGESSVEECGMNPPMPAPQMTPPVSPPSLSLNLNAQGMDNIEQIMKLVAKVNPDAAPKDPGLPSLSAMPSLTPPGPKIGGLGNLDAGPLKMLPDLDSNEGPDMDKPKTIDIKLDKPMGDEKGEEPEDEPKDDEKKNEKEAFGNSLGDSEPEVGDMDDVIRNGDDLHKKKSMYKAAAGGDNPMAAESTDLRSQIRAELLRRLNEAKGAK